MENDIINRYKIKKAGEFRKVANFVLISNSRIYSAKSIADFMKSANHQCTSNTVQKWISYLNEAFVIDQADRYSLKAKKVLENSRKIYNCDVALNSIRCPGNRLGYKISVYNNNGREIDFLAEKGNYRYFIQVAYSVAEENTYQREMSAFKGLSQLDSKILITNDEVDYSTSNVRHIRLRDFLLMDDLSSQQ